LNSKWLPIQANCWNEEGFLTVQVETF